MSSTFIDLPFEIQLKVFSFLAVTDLLRCKQVSKSWNQIARDGLLWQQLDLHRHYRQISGWQMVKLFEDAGSFLQTANIRACSWQKRPHRKNELMVLAKQCRGLKKLDASHCHAMSSSVLTTLAHNCQQLQYLSLVGIHSINSDDMQCLSKSVPMLLNLDISFCKSIGTQGIFHILNNCNELRVLNMAGSSASGQLVHKTEKMYKLRVLNLQLCMHMRDSGVVRLLSRCPNLRKFSMTGCHQLGDVVLESLSLNCKKLTTLEAAYCHSLTDRGFTRLAEQCKRIRQLDLEDCPNITDQSLKTFGRRLPGLTSIILGFCSHVSDEGIEAITLGSKVLKHVEIDNCAMVSDKAVEMLVAHPTMNDIHIYDSPKLLQMRPKNTPNTMKVRYFDRDEANQLVMEAQAAMADRSRNCLIM